MKQLKEKKYIILFIDGTKSKIQSLNRFHLKNLIECNCVAKIIEVKRR